MLGYRGIKVRTELKEVRGQDSYLTNLLTDLGGCKTDLLDTMFNISSTYSIEGAIYTN